MQPFGSVPIYDHDDILLTYAGEVDADTARADDVGLWDDDDTMLACTAGAQIATRASPMAA